MENASKALLMAGGILIAILILSLAVFVVFQARELAEAYDENEKQKEIQQFNINFTQFQNRNNINAQEIVSLIKYYEEYKLKYVSAPDNIIQIINCSGYGIDNIKSDYIEFMKKAGENKWTFECTSIEYDETAKVKSITFKKN